MRATFYRFEFLNSRFNSRCLLRKFLLSISINFRTESVYALLHAAYRFLIHNIRGYIILVQHRMNVLPLKRNQLFVSFPFHTVTCAKLLNEYAANLQKIDQHTKFTLNLTPSKQKNLIFNSEIMFIELLVLLEVLNHFFVCSLLPIAFVFVILCFHVNVYRSMK